MRAANKRRRPQAGESARRSLDGAADRHGDDGAQSQFARARGAFSLEGIGLALHEKFPSIDPLTVRFTDLRQWVVELEDFAGEAAGSSEAKLEAIQMAWHEEWVEAQP